MILLKIKDSAVGVELKIASCVGGAGVAMVSLPTLRVNRLDNFVMNVKLRGLDEMKQTTLNQIRTFIMGLGIINILFGFTAKRICRMLGYKEVKDSNIVFGKLVKLGFIKKVDGGYQASPDTLAG